MLLRIICHLVVPLVVLLSSGAAMAYCQPMPDNEATYYVGNATEQTLCLQGELARSTDELKWRAQVDSFVQNLQSDWLAQQNAQRIPLFDPGKRQDFGF